MNFKFENQGTNTYLVYTIQPEDIIDSMSLGMLTNNKISGLAPTQFMQMDTTKYIKYNVSAHVSVKQFFAGVVNKKRLIGVFKGIVNAMISAEEYMIDTNSIIMDLDYIFADVSTCETVLICLPVETEEAKNIDLRSFFKDIVFSTQFDQTENCGYVAQVINYLNSAPVFLLNDFKNVLDGLDGNVEKTNGTQPTPAVQPQMAPKLSVQQPGQVNPVVQPAIQPTVQQPAKQPVVSATKAPQNQPQKNMPQGQAPQPKMAIPPSQKSAVPPQNNVQQPTEQEMSFFYLMQHYNKENAAAYKAQKAAKKGGTVAPAQKAQPAAKAAKPAVNPGFAIPGQPTSPQPAVQQPVKPSVQPQVQPQKSVAPAVQPRPVQPAPQPAYTPIPQPQSQSMNFGETTVLGAAGGIGETTVLGVAPTAQATPHLIRIKNNERIPLNKPVFRIGKERSYVDYFIGDNTAISRSHANIVSHDGAYYVVDTNSTNHTYVNGVMIQSNSEVKLEHGAKLRFANEEFEFNTY